MTIHFAQVASEEEIQQILELQARNHGSALDAATAADQGFVTVRHEPDVLRRMNRAHPSVIAKRGDRLAGYCLVMLPDFATDVPILAPMFATLETLSWRGRPLRDWRWFVMGQVCVAEEVRGQGVFDGLYARLREACRGSFDVVVTEIAERNTRSIRAHERVGFETMHTYREDVTGEVWRVVGWSLQGAERATDAAP